MPEQKKELPPTGSHRAVLYKLINLGTLTTEWNGQEKKQHKIRLYWELSDEKVTYEKDGETVSKPFSVGGKYTYSLFENSHLTPIVTGMLGTKLHEDEIPGFDIETLLGTPCLITVIHDEYNGNKFAKVSNVTVLPRGMEAPTQVNKTEILDVRKLSQQEIGELPEFIRKDMESSAEYHVRFNAPRAEEDSKIPGTDIDYPESDEDIVSPF